MKKSFIAISAIVFLFATSTPFSLEAQFLKNVLNSVKNTVQNKANSKATQVTNQVLDQVDGTAKPKTDATTTPPPTSSISATTAAGSSSSATGQQAGSKSTVNQDNADSDSSFITLNVSSKKILVGGSVIISGSSVMFQSFNKVALTISGPSVNDSRTIALNNDGSFSTTWQSGGPGSYRISVKSSDGKGGVSDTLNVYQFTEMEMITGPPKEATKKAYENLVKWVERITPELVPKDGSDLQKRMTDVTDRKNKVLQLFDDLDDAGKGLDDIEKKYGSVSPSVTENLSQLNDLLSTQATHMEQLNDIAQHEPTDNSICEYLVMVNEACAAFLTFTEFYAKCPAILANLASDRVIAPGVGAAGNAAGASEGNAEMARETAKLFSASKLDADWGETITSSLGKAGLAGELSQMCSEVFLKRYCVVMSGDLKENYQCTFRNEYNNVWWQYNYTTEATISLRYPRDNQGGKMIKMKGNIEGNATKFSIYQKASEIDAFREAMKGRANLYSILLYAPPSVPFSSAKADKNVGFGAIARAMVTPAYFNIPIDADYDVEAKNLKIYLNGPLMDFNPSLVRYIYCYITFPLGIPLTTRIDYPINSVKLTLGKVIEKNNDFDIKTDAENNLSILKKGSTVIGKNTSIEHHIDFTLSAKSD